jgi:hypothetical protein
VSLQSGGFAAAVEKREEGIKRNSASGLLRLLRIQNQRFNRNNPSNPEAKKAL